MNGIIPTRKHKNETLDTYSCIMCGRIWKSSANKIGHKQQACDNYSKKHGY